MLPDLPSLISICLFGAVLSFLIALGVCKAIILASRAPQPDLLNSARTNVTQFRRNNELACKQRREIERQLHKERIAQRQTDNTFTPILCAPIVRRATGVDTDKFKVWGEKLARLNERVRLDQHYTRKS